MVRFGRILNVIEEDNLVDNAAKVGKYLLSRLETMADNHEYLSNARGLGLMCASDLPDSHSRNAVVSECMKHGMMILSCGDNTVRFRPPLTVTTEHIDEGLNILENAYKAALTRCPVAH